MFGRWKVSARTAANSGGEANQSTDFITETRSIGTAPHRSSYGATKSQNQFIGQKTSKRVIDL